VPLQQENFFIITGRFYTFITLYIRYPANEKINQRQELLDFYEGKKELGQISGRLESTILAIYGYTAGEITARTTAGRIGWTPDERRKRFPSGVTQRSSFVTVI